MKNIISLAILLIAVLMITVTGCELNPQGSKEKMAYNNLMAELKASSMMDGKIGSVKYLGNTLEFDFTEPSIEKTEMRWIAGNVITMYANNNNSAGTGITALKAFAKISGKEVLKVVYNAGPSHNVEGNLVFTWADGTADSEVPEYVDN